MDVRLTELIIFRSRSRVNGFARESLNVWDVLTRKNQPIRRFVEALFSNSE